MDRIQQIPSMLCQETTLSVKDIVQHATAFPITYSIPWQQLTAVCEILYRNTNLYFDVFTCLTVDDHGPVVNNMDIMYHLYSIPYQIALVLKIVIHRGNEKNHMPVVPSVSHLWKAALWHERESYDLFGICFQGHPDLRRILLPEDWQGYPLRKDYHPAKSYQGIPID